VRRHPVFYAMPVVLGVLTLVVLGVLELLGADCYEGSIDGPGNCNDLAAAQHEFVAPIGFGLAALFLLVVVWREADERLRRRND
jgi:TRAP-type C4-dicarboxylate transport system permease small subunit